MLHAITKTFKYLTSVKNRPDIAVQSSDLYDSLFVQISNLSYKDILVGVIYKPPNTNTEEFVAQFSHLLEKLNEENRPTYLSSDYNIDRLKYYNTTHRQTFLNQFLSYGFFLAIDRPTYTITDTTATQTDNIYTDVHHKNIKSCIWFADISDHLPICATIPGSLLLLYACSILYAKHLYPAPIPLLYNPFTIVLHNLINAYRFRSLI